MKELEEHRSYGVAIPGGVAVLLPGAGFTATGVGVATMAATTQSSIGNLVVGSAFASPQRTGMFGMGVPKKDILKVAGAVIGAILLIIVIIIFSAL